MGQGDINVYQVKNNINISYLLDAFIYTLYECFFDSITDVDECSSNNGGCHVNASCTNDVGSRTCKCKLGFSGDGINSCAGM